MRFNLSIGLILAASLLGGCSDNRAYETAMCVLADISGTYADQKKSVARVVKAGVVSQLLPGDNLFFITIDSNSYHKDNLKGKLSLDYIPSKANQQRLAFADTLDEFAKTGTRARYTDISGAMMLCTDYLKATAAGFQSIMIFSDMKEELRPGLTREFSENEFENINIAAMNVIKLKADSSNPEVYRDRLANWEKRVLKAGAAGWEVINDPVNIPEYIERLRE